MIRLRLTIPDVMPLVAAFAGEPRNCVGGCLHIVLDEGNVGDGNIDDAREWARSEGDMQAYALCLVLSQMTKTQRRKIAAKFPGIVARVQNCGSTIPPGR